MHQDNAPAVITGLSEVSTFLAENHSRQRKTKNFTSKTLEYISVDGTQMQFLIAHRITDLMWHCQVAQNSMPILLWFWRHIFGVPGVVWCDRWLIISSSSIFTDQRDYSPAFCNVQYVDAAGWKCVKSVYFLFRVNQKSAPLFQAGVRTQADMTLVMHDQNKRKSKLGNQTRIHETENYSTTKKQGSELYDTEVPLYFTLKNWNITA